MANKPARVLVVDDDPAVRRVTRSLLEHLGHTVTVANDGFGCLAALSTFEPEVILLDMMMPEKDGIETLREIRELDASIPIIAMSGGGRIEASLCLRFASNLGAPLLLHKPFNAEELNATINRALEHQQRKSDDAQAS